MDHNQNARELAKAVRQKLEEVDLLSQELLEACCHLRNGYRRTEVNLFRSALAEASDTLACVENGLVG